VRLSVVVISRNEGKRLRQTVENLDDTLPDGGEIIVVDDGSTDRSADSLGRRRGRVRVHRVNGHGVARARNFGARLCLGDLIVFADAHIGLGSGWWRPLAEATADPRVGAAAPGITNMRKPEAKTGYGLTFKGPSLDVRWLRRRPKSPAPAAILPGCCFAIRRKVLEATGGWDDGLHQRGGVDNEISVRLWLLGYELLITPGATVAHLFRKESPYPVGWAQYLSNRLRLAFVHWNEERLGKVVASLRNLPEFGEALALLIESDISKRRLEIRNRRVRDDDWYFEKFGLHW
jgi:glycosyltransferase involved in cell wall biosynthesis